MSPNRRASRGPSCPLSRGRRSEHHPTRRKNVGPAAMVDRRTGGAALAHCGPSRRVLAKQEHQLAIRPGVGRSHRLAVTHSRFCRVASRTWVGLARRALLELPARLQLRCSAATRSRRRIQAGNRRSTRPDAAAARPEARNGASSKARRRCVRSVVRDHRRQKRW